LESAMTFLALPLDVLGQAFLTQRHHLFGCFHRLEQGCGRLVDALVGGLGRQHHRHQQSVEIDVLQLGLRIGRVFLQPREELLGLGAGKGFGHQRPSTSVME
jgi:hypothetical protein